MPSHRVPASDEDDGAVGGRLQRRPGRGQVVGQGQVHVAGHHQGQELAEGRKDLERRPDARGQPRHFAGFLLFFLILSKPNFFSSHSMKIKNLCNILFTSTDDPVVLVCLSTSLFPASSSFVYRSFHVYPR